MDDMAQTVPIRDMLAVPAIERAMPKFDMPAGADGRPTHQEQQRAGQQRYDPGGHIAPAIADGLAFQ